MLMISEVITTHPSYFINIKVSCYDKKVNGPCLVSNETDDYARKYLIATLLRKLQTMKHNNIIVYEISNDKSKNWNINDKSLMAHRLQSPLKENIKKSSIKNANLPILSNSSSSKTPTKIKKPNSHAVKKIWVVKSSKTTPKTTTVIKSVPSLKSRPIYTHSNMSSGTPEQFGINPIITRKIIQRMKHASINRPS